VICFYFYYLTQKESDSLMVHHFFLAFIISGPLRSDVSIKRWFHALNAAFVLVKKTKRNPSEVDFQAIICRIDPIGKLVSQVGMQSHLMTEMGEKAPARRYPLDDLQ